MNIKAEESISDKTLDKDEYGAAERKRKEYIDAVLQSDSNKKIVVAGPGTGKTYLFERILEGKKNVLTLTFVNSLVEDLSLEFCGLSEVKTLHGFALGIMNKATSGDIKVFPKLSKVIKEDARILLNEEIDFDDLFQNKTAEEKHIKFYKRRKKYYGCYGFTDIVFAAVRLFEEKKDKIPSFTQVLVDEFQDFNRLEVRLIELLAEKSPILIVGDDDQALYESLKSASPMHIRQTYDDRTSGYSRFSLPYCSRCTRVIVKAVNDIIVGAENSGHLSSRIRKPFQYFANEEKDKVSNKNGQLIYRQLQATQIPFYIQRHIEEIAKEVRSKFTVLIICPTNIHCRTVLDALKKKGFVNVNFTEKDETKEPTLLDGLKLLLKERNCNLGWRVVAKKLLKDIEFETLLKDTDNDSPLRIFDLIQPELKKEVSQMLETLREVRDGDQTEDETKLEELLNKVGVDAYGMARDYLRDEIKSYKPKAWKPSSCKPEVRKIPITIATIQRSKGLEADYVFIAYFDDQYLIKDESKVSDEEICSFVVALTRAKKRVFLFSSDTNKRPVFLKWIDEKRIREIRTKDKTAL